MSPDPVPGDGLSEEAKREWASRNADESVAATLALMRASLHPDAEGVEPMSAILTRIVKSQGVEGVYVLHRALADTLLAVTGLKDRLNEARENVHPDSHAAIMMVSVDPVTGERTWNNAAELAEQSENGAGLLAATRFVVAAANEDFDVCRALFESFMGEGDPSMLVGLLRIVGPVCAPYLDGLEDLHVEADGSGSESVEQAAQRLVRAVLARDRAKVEVVREAAQRAGDDVYFALHLALAVTIMLWRNGVPGTNYAVRMEVILDDAEGSRTVVPEEVLEEPARTMVRTGQFLAAVIADDMDTARAIFNVHRPTDGLIMGLCAMIEETAIQCAAEKVNAAMGEGCP